MKKKLHPGFNLRCIHDMNTIIIIQIAYIKESVETITIKYKHPYIHALHVLYGILSNKYNNLRSNLT